jgi:hypothetical protein
VTLAECGEHIGEVPADAGADIEETVNTEGAAELVLDKGYRSNDVLLVLRQVAVRVYRAEPERDGATGRRNSKSRERFTRTAGAFAANGESGCYETVENGSNAASPICMRRGRCGERICASMETLSNGC